MVEPAVPPAALLELEIGNVAHGGHCVARVGNEPDGRVVFVRHAIPGERALVHVTEDPGGSFCRGDAVKIIRASPERVAPPCAYAGPGRCGGCDWQHLEWSAQRRLKSMVVIEQFARLARLDVSVEVEPLAGPALGWRTRTVYAIDSAGRAGLHRHRSRDVQPVDQCLLGAPGVGDHSVLSAGRPGVGAVEVARGDDPEAAVLVHTPRPVRGRQRPADRVELAEGPSTLRHIVDGRAYAVAAGGFWQVHPAAAETFLSCVLTATGPQPGELAIDLYAGAGLFTAGLAQRVGPGGRVVGIESSRQAVADAAANLAALPWAEVRQGQVTAGLLASLELRPAVIVLDPPRAGVGQQVAASVASYGARVIAYLSCDPASLARDTAYLLSAGWRLSALRAFDAFPMTAHIECLAVFHPA